MARRRARARCSFCGKQITLPLYQVGANENPGEAGAEPLCLDCGDLDVKDAREDGRAYHRSGLQPINERTED